MMPVSSGSKWARLSTHLDAEVRETKFLRKASHKAHAMTATTTKANSSTTKKYNTLQTLHFT
jgi:hypothetical protein